MEEPSVLDYLKSKLMPWRYPRLDIPQAERAVQRTSDSSMFQPNGQTTLSADLQFEESAAHTTRQRKDGRLPWRGLLALSLVMMAQFSFSPGYERDWKTGGILLAFSIALLIWSNLADEWRLPPLPEKPSETDPPTVNLSSLLIGAFLALVAFLSFGSLQFNLLNLALLLLSLAFIMRGLRASHRSSPMWLHKFSNCLHPPPWSVTFHISTLMALAIIGWVVFFRFYHLAHVPPEMNSDHAEKFLDVLRILNGQANIFFPSNGGREGLQFYLVAGLNHIFGLPLDFMALKLVSSLVGFMALPFVYLLGKEIGSPRLGWLAFLFAGIAYWPNVVSRFGLRLPFYMLFSAAMMFYLLRGIYNTRRNDLIIAGIWLGVSFYGYSADRILPFLVLTAIVLYLIHPQQSSRQRLSVTVSLAALVIVSFVIFIPLLRYLLAEPESFFLRTLTRMGSWERPILEPLAWIFIKNVGKALAMFSCDNGVVWPISIPSYPALSIVSGALFYMGVGLVLLRYIRHRNWLDLFLLISIPILMLPSILALAFPDENPNLYRTGGAIVPVFLMIALALDSLMHTISRKLPAPYGKRLAWMLALFLLLFNSLQDYNLVFHKYYEQYKLSSWNSSEMGHVARSFIDTYQSPDTVRVVGFPNWVDTRLVANNAGFPGRDFEIKAENLPESQALAGPKLFFLNPDDQAAQFVLKQLYPEGRLYRYKSKIETKDFLIFMVLPEQD